MLTEIEVTIDVTVSVLIAEYVETDVTVSVVVDTSVDMESTTAVEVAVNGNTHEVMVEGAASSCCGDLDPNCPLASSTPTGTKMATNNRTIQRRIPATDPQQARRYSFSSFSSRVRYGRAEVLVSGSTTYMLGILMVSPAIFLELLEV
jgi:hypothetical protein